MRWAGSRLWLVPCVFALVGCVHGPDSYPLPASRGVVLQPSDLDPPVADMAAGDVDEYIVKDVSPNGGASWRWTLERPELRFILNCTAGQKFFADFGVVAATLQQTGPITVSFYVNGHLLGTADCPTAGDRHFEREVPAAWLSTSGYTDVVLQANKLYVSPEDGAKLGFTLIRAGFLESCPKSSPF